MAEGTVRINIDGDSSGIETSIKKTTTTVDSEVKKQRQTWDEYAKSTGKTFEEIENDVKKLAQRFQSEGATIPNSFKKAYAEIGIVSKKEMESAKSDLESLETKSDTVSDSIEDNLKDAVKDSTDTVQTEVRKQRQTWDEYAQSTGKTFNEIEADVAAMARKLQSEGKSIPDSYKEAFREIGIYSKASMNDMEKDFEDAEVEANQSAEKIESHFRVSFSKISSYASSALTSFNTFSLGIGRGLAIGATLVAGAVSAYGGKVATMASDLQEVQNVVDVTFEGSADTINKFALDAANNFGLTELSAKQFSGTLGAMMKSSGLAGDDIVKMSTDLTGLTGDFASFYNLGHEEAFNKIRAGISGETEPLKQLGINMSVANLEAYALAQGITTSYDAMAEAEKVTLRYNYLMSVSADAQGDFARTSESFANQLRIVQLQFTDLGTSIGSVLLPTLTSGVAKVGEYAQSLKEAFDTDGFSGLAKQLGLVITDALNELLEQAPELIGFVSELLVSLGTELVNASPILVASARTAFESLVSGFRDVMPVLSQLAYEIVPLIAEILITGYPLLLELGINILTALVTGIADNLDTLIPVAQRALDSLIDAIVTNLPLLISAASQIILALANFIAQNASVLVGVAVLIITSLVDFITQNVSLILETALIILLTLVEAIFTNLPLLINAAVGLVQALVDFITQNISMILDMTILIIEAIIQGILDNLEPLVLAAIEITLAIIQGIIEILPELINAIVELVNMIVQTLLNNLPLLLSAGVQIIKAMISGILSMVGSLLSNIGNMMKSVVSSILSIIGSIFSAGAEILSSLVRGILSGVGNLLSNIGNIISNIWTKFTSTNWGSIGSSIISGIASGISGAVGKVIDAAKSAAKSAFDAAKDFLGINSPSKLFRDNIGLGIDEGIAVGIEKYSPMVEKASEDVSKKSIDASAKTLADKALSTFSDSYRRVNTSTANNIQSTSTTNNVSTTSDNNDNRVTNIVENKIEFNRPVETPDTVAREVNKITRSSLAGAR